MNDDKHWGGSHSLGVFAILVLIPLVAVFSISAGGPLWAWFATFVLILLFLLVAGDGILGVWRGVLINDCNVISLSRLQMVIWTVIVLSAFLTAALWNLWMGLDDALAIGIPTELWALMGISTTSLVGSPLILSAKKAKQPADEEKSKTIALLAAQGDEAKSLGNKGLVITNTDPKSARWTDMFTGDETSNAAHLDLPKIQMFFFTLIIALTYCFALGKLFLTANAGGFNAFPNLDQSVLALLGISHAGYLVSKGTPHSQSKS